MTRKPRRLPFPETFRRASDDLLKSAERLERLRQDDRYRAYVKDSERPSYQLTHSVDVLKLLVEDLPPAASDTQETSKS